jgi:hypothetical protein
MVIEQFPFLRELSKRGRSKNRTMERTHYIENTIDHIERSRCLLRKKVRTAWRRNGRAKRYDLARKRNCVRMAHLNN